MLWRIFITYILIAYIYQTTDMTPETAIALLVLGIVFAILEYLAESS